MLLNEMDVATLQWKKRQRKEQLDKLHLFSLNILCYQTNLNFTEQMENNGVDWYQLCCCGAVIMV